MPKLFIAALLASYAACAAAGGYLDGEKLYDRYRAKQRMVQDTGGGLASDAIDAGFYIGYVQGAAEALTDVLCLPEKLSAAQAEEIVGKYLQAHPEKRKKHAALLVRNALAEAYPCANK